MRTLFFKREAFSQRGQNFLPSLPHHFSKEEEKKAFQMLEREPGNLEARNKIVVRNLRLVCRIADKMDYLREEFRLDPGDILSYGVFGLLRAIESFDWRRGYKFSTYATAWIYQYIKHFARQGGSLIKKSAYYSQLTAQCKKLSQRIGQELMSYSNDGDLLKRKLFTKHEIKRMEENNFLVVSLDSYPGDDDEDGRHLIDLKGSEEKGYQMVEEEDNRKRIQAFLEKHLNPREKIIIEKRTGLRDGVVWTLAEIGRMFDLSRERIRQIQDKAFKKIKGSKEKAILKKLLI